MAELHLLSTARSAERQLDVVFVHGLGGNWQGTWGNGAEEGNSWPNWLAAEPELSIGVWSLSYPASSSRWEWFKAVIQAKVCGERRDPEAGAAMALPRRAANVLDRLALAGIGQWPVVFITHSLGGLLVKSVLRLAAESPDAPERRRVVEQTRGVMFVATPHQGSSLATLATAIQFYLPSVSVRDLRANDAHLNALFLWYRSYAPRHNILTRSYFENQATNGVVVVTASSADPGVTGPTARDPVPLDRNHVEICRPRDRGDQMVLGSVELIRQILQGNPTHPAQSVPAAAGDRAAVVVRTFAPQGNADSDAALLIDLTDLFHDRLPIHNEVWSRAIPERIAAALPAIAELPQPVVLAPQAHLSIAWFLGVCRKTEPRGDFSPCVPQLVRRGIDGMTQARCASLTFGIGRLHDDGSDRGLSSLENGLFMPPPPQA